ncbi:MAG: carbon storage regulator [Pirellulales bacterium]
MLVLSRKVGEKIRIGDDIVVMVTSISGDRVRLGISGPPEVPIHREELVRRLQTESLAADLPRVASRLPEPSPSARSSARVCDSTHPRSAFRALVAAPDEGSGSVAVVTPACLYQG